MQLKYERPLYFVYINGGIILLRKIITILLIKVIILSLPSVFATTGFTSNLELKVETSFNTYFFGETINIEIKLKNIGDKPVRIEFPTSQNADCQIYTVINNQLKDLIYHWSYGRAFLQVITPLSLEAGESKTLLTINWNTGVLSLPHDKPLKLLVKGWAPAIGIRPEGAIYINLIPPYGGVSDIKSHWGEKEIREILGTGLLKLDNYNRFNPESPLKRIDFLYALAKILKLPFTTTPYSPYSDVPPDHPYINEILALHARGIIKGYPDGTLRPDTNLGRAETAVLVSLSLNLKEELKLTFSDVPSSHWAFIHISRVVKANIMKGYNENIFAPSNPLSRVQASVVLVKIKRITGFE